MALSQKHRGKILVPWFSSDEWRMVYNLIYSGHSSAKDKENALNMLQIWKTRTPLLFAGLEGTLTVLEVLLLDHTKLQENVLCSLYATAILRFLNICAANSVRQGTFYQTARKKNLPDWLINIRHDLAHSQKLPSKFMLNLSLKYCLNWLKSMYWDLQNDAIEDYIVNEPDAKSSLEELIKVFCESTFGSLNGEDVRESYFEKISDFGINIKKTTRFITVQKRILNCLATGKQHSTENNTIVDCIVQDGNIFLIPNELTPTGKCKYIPREVFEAWRVLLQYLEQHNLLMKFIEKLFNLTSNETIDNDIKLRASLWLAEIFKNILKKQIDYAVTLNRKNGHIEFHKTGKAKFKMSDVSDTLSFAEYSPNLIKDLDKFKNDVLFTPNEYVEVYLRKLLLVVGCHKSFISDMEIAINSFVHVNPDINLNDKLYSIKDVNKLFEDIMIEEMETDGDNEINYTINGDKLLNSGKRWHEVDDTTLFDGYPLGVLPHQYGNKNPIL